jgi:hypothetical protein
VVALFGPNGAGKSRILRIVRAQAQADTTTFAHPISLEARLETAKKELKRITNILGVAKNESPPDPPETLEHLRREVDKRQAAEQALAAYLLQCQARYGGRKIGFPVVELKIDSQLKASPRMIRALATQIIKPEKKPEFGQNTLGYLTALAGAKYEIANPNANKEQVDPLVTLFTQAERLIEDLMHMKLGFVPQIPGAVPSLDGRPIKPDELSDGQRILLKFVVYLLQHQMQTPDKVQDYSESIVFIDEPELHLHPHVLIDFVARMRKLVGETGQIWLATHSISLLPFLKPNEVWVVDRGEVRPPGAEQNENALRALIGNDENIERLRGFLQEPARAAAINFASQTLFPPQQAPFKEDDPQLPQAATVLRNRLSVGKDFAILDFGAGIGRLAEALRRDCDAEQIKHVRYYAVEPQESLHPNITLAAGPLLADSPFLSIGELPGTYEGYFDVCFACNVLHEIRPTKWREQLELLLTRIKADGMLVILEDQEMPKGELPHELGFLVLGSRELQTLFSLSNSPRQLKHPDTKYAERLLCVEIPASQGKVSRDSVRKAITDLRGRLKALVENMRKSTSGRDGRRYAFYSHMMINAEFALEEM